MDEKPGKLKIYWKVILGYSLVAIALAVFFLGNHAIQAYKIRSLASREWPTVEGRIIESRAVENVSTDSDGNTSVSYKAVIIYAYVVNGIRHTSDQLGWEDHLYRDSMAEAQRLADSYPVAKMVVVHYDPEQPEFGLLNTTLPERPDDLGIGYFIACGAILAIAAALIYSHTGLLFRIPGLAIILGSMVVFMGGGILTWQVGVYLAVLIGFGFVSFGIGAFVRSRQ